MKSHSSQQTDNYLQYEEKIVWLKAIEKYPWVRVSEPFYHKQKGLSESKLKEFSRNGEIVVGYADLSDDAPPMEQIKGVRKHFKRRIFIVQNSDYEVYDKREDYPLEAVITKSLEPKFKGVSQSQHLEYSECLKSKTEVEFNRALPDEEITTIIPNEEIIAISPDEETDTIISGEEITAIFPDEIDSTQEFREGAVRKVLVNAYERDTKARQKCIDHYGLSCSVCNFNFGQVFGEFGKGFIHVHHLRPISGIGEEYVVDPIQDLRPVCPNCHAMIHRCSPPLSIQEIKDLL